MSTTDPAHQRRADLESRRGRLGPVYAGYAATVGLVAAGGLGITTMVGYLRESTLLPYSTGYDSAGVWGAFLITLAFVGAIVAGLTGKEEKVARSRVTDPRLPGLVGWATFTVVILLGVQSWRDPPVVGERPGLFEGDPPGPWGFGSWLLYRLDLLLPTLVVAITLLVGWRWWRGEQRERRLAADRDRLLVSGHRVTGTITEAAVHHSTDDSGSRRVTGATATIRFSDASGTARWVTRRTTQASLVAPGFPAQVLFDPMAPDDVERIFVSFVAEPDLSDWTPA